MSVLFILILISGIIALAFLVGFIWSVRSGQYDDTYSPSVRILFQDIKPDKVNKEPKKSKTTSSQSSEDQD